MAVKLSLVREKITCLILVTSIMLSFYTSSAINDYDILLSFKSSVNDPFRYLSNWNSSNSLCNWNGITCRNSTQQVTKLDISSKNISGVHFSTSLLNLQFIETVDLSNNQFSGKIPEKIFSCFSLRYLNLSNNNFTGSIPNGFIPNLETLDFSNNMLSGEIPDDITLFSGLRYLDLGGNVLEGEITKKISSLQNLEYFTLAGNQLTGGIPKEISVMKNLKWIYLGYNNLSGEIPEEIGSLSSLSHLDLVYNKLTGTIPSSFGNLSNLHYLFLYQNKLTGSIPDSIFNLRNLISLDVSDNFLSGELSELVIQLQNLEIFHLFSNNFTGRIPRSLARLRNLKVLQLWSNKLSGDIPQDLGKFNNLTVLDLSTNNLTGKIPEGLCSSGSLYKLILFKNSLEGGIPKSLGSCKSLQRIRMQNNLFSGELPSEFVKLPLVYFLDLSGNHFSGKIGEEKWEMPSLEMLSLASNKFHGKLPYSFGSKKLQSLDLSENHFSGGIPSGYGRLSELVQLKLNQNQLSGMIPAEISFCKKLVKLDISQNHLTGQIPVEFSEMPVLGSMDLSGNDLSGEIPPDLGKVESLVQINISHNHFHGGLPSTGAFVAINSSAVIGNDLCGSNSISGLPACKVTKKPIWWLFITSLLVVVAVLGLAISIILFIKRRNEMELSIIDDPYWNLKFYGPEKHRKMITLEDILSAATKEDNVISRGKDGVMYKGKAAALNGVQFVVHELKEMNGNGTISTDTGFWKGMENLGKVKHQNVIKLLGICRSEKDGFLIYEYINSWKSLRDVLAGLNWNARRKIVMGIGKALKFLHGKFSHSVLAGVLSTEKIVIGEDGEPCLRPKISNNGFSSSSYATPEDKENNKDDETTEDKLQQSSNGIYEFGILMIEILTGKGITDAELGMHDNIVEWARYCYSDCHVDTWIEPSIKGEIMLKQQHHQIVEMMKLALQCTTGDPTARPSASYVMRTLETIEGTGYSCTSRLNVKVVS
ncbi:hypothetical protein C5167_018654 [Papaver somniferum]|uniref:Protein kinase domain-containing protein n=1 Tax=Papaver somniferum TaxID=3469 RepID=A0A4Y7IR80_PAPSO|nr:probably inactive leucine-rich repeat receptor-like protein kinase At2g25790 [Papaver somniferum]RZC50231.1 hypothetical protein C5167_018654 [Papaver somniferum]